MTPPLDYRKLILKKSFSLGISGIVVMYVSLIQLLLSHTLITILSLKKGKCNGNINLAKYYGFC